MMLVSLISYIDRNTLALLAPTILRETAMSAKEYGFIISAFSIAYMVGNPVWGRVLDRVGVRIGMTSAVSLWTVASAAHAFASGLLSFGVARTVLGFGEGATFPGGLRTVVQTLPAASRSRGIALAYSGGSLGAVVTPIVVTPVAAWYGWRGAFWFTGLVGLAWLAAWAVISRRPDIRKMPEAQADGAAVSVRDRRLWTFMSIYALGGLPLAFVLYSSSLYLSKVLGKSQTEIGAVLWIPPLGWEIGYFAWGWIIDRFTHHGERLRPVVVVLAMLSMPLGYVGETRSFALTMALMAVSMFVGAGFIVTAMAYAMSIFSTRQSSFIAGVGAGSWSAVVALVMPAFGQLFDEARYSVAFVIAAAIPVVGAIIWLALGGGRPGRR